MSSASKAASLFISLGLLDSVCWQLILKPAHISSSSASSAGADPAGAGPSVPGSCTRFSRANGTGRICLSVLSASQGHAAEQAKSSPGKEPLLGNLHFFWQSRDRMGWSQWRPPLAWSAPRSAAPTSVTVPTASGDGGHVVCQSPTWPKRSSITCPWPHLCLLAAAFRELEHL